MDGRWRVAAVILAAFMLAATASCVPTPAGSTPTGGSASSVAGTTTISVWSAALGRAMPVEVFVPEGLPVGGRAPVLYLFHGRGGDESSWMAGHGSDGIGIDATASELVATGKMRPLVIVSARIDDSYGVDSTAADDGYAHGQYEHYIVDDLVTAIESRYAVGGDPARRAVGGYSMGGFVALSLVLRRPDLFRSAAALSPAIFRSPPADRAWIYGVDGSRDPLRLVETTPLDHLRLFLGYGDADYGWVREATDDLAASLTQRGLGATPVVVPGGHDVSTWRQLARPMLASLFEQP
jgi:enterochelin esterase-like enzyme